MPTPLPSPSTGCGEFEITLARPIDSFNIEVYRADYRINDADHIWGHTDWGNHGLAALDIFGSGKNYDGYFGDTFQTDLYCSTGGCSGVIDGNKTKFDIASSSGTDVITGKINDQDVKITRNADDITAEASNGTKMRLHRKRKGHWDGEAIYYSEHNELHHFEVVLETNGSLENVPDNVLLTLFIGAPLTRHEHY